MPSKPELEIINGNPRGQVINEQFVAKCSSRNGMPAPKLAWFLDDEPLTENLGQAEIIETPGVNNLKLYTTSQTIRRNIQPTDNGKRLICRVTHIAKNTPQESNILLQVTCKYFEWSSSK